jgi:hypothetical protein
VDITQFNPEDRLQKTWIPEGTAEYKQFKFVTDENHFLADYLKKLIPLAPNDLVLDVGGREGDIALNLQKPDHFHLIDPDPTLKLSFEPARYWREKVQNVDLHPSAYKLIIMSHVLGYLGTQHVQKEVFEQLIKAIAPGGTLVLFYNTNAGYMGDLLRFSQEILLNGHYDYFDESLLDQLDKDEFQIKKKDVSFDLDYKTHEELARCCWFLFGAMDQNIEGVSEKFLPKLKMDLERPSFPIEERVTLVTRIIDQSAEETA